MYLVVDDGSPDGTAAEVEAPDADCIPGKLFVEERRESWVWEPHISMGSNGRSRKGYEFIFEMDADFSHNPSDLERLYEPANIAGL